MSRGLASGTPSGRISLALVKLRGSCSGQKEAHVGSEARVLLGVQNLVALCGWLPKARGLDSALGAPETRARKVVLGCER